MIKINSQLARTEVNTAACMVQKNETYLGRCKEGEPYIGYRSYSVSNEHHFVVSYMKEESLIIIFRF